MRNLFSWAANEYFIWWLLCLLFFPVLIVIAFWVLGLGYIREIEGKVIFCIMGATTIYITRKSIFNLIFSTRLELDREKFNLASYYIETLKKYVFATVIKPIFAVAWVGFVSIWWSRLINEYGGSESTLKDFENIMKFLYVEKAVGSFLLFVGIPVLYKVAIEPFFSFLYSTERFEDHLIKLHEANRR